MFTQLVLPIKRRVDIITVAADFTQLLQPGEIIVDASLNVLVFSGVDSFPNHMLDGGIFITDAVVSHRVKLGVPGVVYQLIFTATTDLDNIYVIEGRQAIKRNELPAGPLYTEHYFTTTIYPINSVDAIGVDSVAVQGRTSLWANPLDGLSVSTLPLDGTIRDILHTYAIPPEGLEITTDVLNGELNEVLIVYTPPPEGVYVSSVARNGTLRNVYIVYSHYPPEGVAVTSTALSGSLI